MRLHPFALALVTITLVGGCRSDLREYLSDQPSADKPEPDESDASVRPTVKVCSDGTWDHDDDEATTCAPHTDCPAGSYVKAPGTPTTDRSCEECAEGTFNPDANSSECDDWQKCPPGTFVATPGTAKVDATCSGCASGSFSSEENSERCTPWTDCQPGQHVSEPGTDATDRECVPCSDGKSSLGMNASACVGAEECPQGTKQTAPATLKTPATCEACRPGYHCAGGEAKELACAANEWDEDKDPATPCVPKTICRAGSFAKSAGSTTEDQTCAPCPEGEFSDSSNAKSCTPWRTCAAPSSYMSAEPSPTTNRVCKDCEPPEATDNDNQTECRRVIFQMDQGEVVFEAEHYTSRNDNGVPSTEAWTKLNVEAASGDWCMELPAPAESEIVWAPEDKSMSPRLDYNVYFPETGDYTVYIRGSSGVGGGRADSCWGGIDDVLIGDDFVFPQLAETWGWDSQTVSVTAGLHTFTVWAREDGARVDKIVINNTGVIPTGDGPAESPTQ